MLCLLLILVIIALVIYWLCRSSKKESYDVCSDLCGEASGYGCGKAGPHISAYALLEACKGSSQAEIIQAMEKCGDQSGAKFAVCALKALQS